MSEAAARTSPTVAPARTAEHALIQSLTPRGGEAVEVSPITVLVGPNNSGKTEILRDILRLGANVELADSDRSSDDEPQPVVLSDLAFVPKLSLERMLLGLTVCDPDSREGTVVQGIAPNLKTPLRRSVSKELKNVLARPVMSARSTWMSALGQLMPLRMAYLVPDDRRRLVAPTAARSPLDGPENLLQLLHYAAAETHETLDAAFQEVFNGIRLRLDASQQVQLTLRVSANDFPRPLADPLANAQQYQALPSVHLEGDAFQHAAAVMLTLLTGRGRVILLDQPEAFLHPEQARRLGRWMAKLLPKLSCQLIVATASTPLLQGLAEAKSAITILRTSRRESVTRLHAIPSEPAKAFARIPLFTCQDALRSLFCDGAVVVPEDRDQIVYETTAAQFTDQQNLCFLQAVGARNLPFMAGALRQAGIPVAVITELDVFRSEREFTELVKAVTGGPPPQPWLATRERMASHIEGWFDEEAIAQAAHEVESFLARQQTLLAAADEADDDAEYRVGRNLKNWDKLRHERLEWLPRELRIWVEELIEELKRKGIFVSPKGRLEAWLELEVRDPTVWVNNVMQTLHRGKCPSELKTFVTDMVTYLRAAAAPARNNRFRT